MEIGPQAKGESPFTAKYRKMQSEYRANVLEVKFGKGPNENSDTYYGNMLVNGDKTGLNFISDAAFKFAKQKVLDKQINKVMTIDKFRLFNNMLSSQPMCFNLFADLRELLLTNQSEVSRIVKSLFKELNWIDKVTYIDVEFIPVPISDYTNDRSAFDAMILVEDSIGKKGLISIETKYTDLLGTNTASSVSLKDNIIKNNKIFDADQINTLKEDGYPQVHRNYLLTYVYGKKNTFKHFANVVISPKDDKHSVEEIDNLKNHLLQDKNTIMKISLENIVERGQNCGNNLIEQVMNKFKERYLE